MKLEQIRYLLEISRLHSISAAARTLHVGQTTLSAIVKVVEEEIGFPIFQRTPHGVLATPKGEQFMSLAWEINVKYEELMLLKRRVAGGAPAISVLIAPTIAARLAIPLSEHFARFDVHGHLIFEEAASETICGHILDKHANLGLTYLTEEEIIHLQNDYKSNHLKIERLLEDKLCLLVREDHRFADRDWLDAEEVLGERIVKVGPRRKDKILGDLISHGNRLTCFSSVDDMYQAVLTHGLVGFVPGFIGEYGRDHMGTNLKLIPLRLTAKENRMYLCMVTCKNRDMRYQDDIVVACIRQYFQTYYPLKTTALENGGADS